MPTSSSRLAYPDCEEFLHRAVVDGVGVRLPFNTEGQARGFLVRCNTFRQICRKDNKEIYTRDNPMFGRSEFDCLMLTVVPTEDASDWFVYARVYAVNEEAIESLSEVEGAPHGS